jgi:hypothetical protein
VENEKLYLTSSPPSLRLMTRGQAAHTPADDKTAAARPNYKYQSGRVLHLARGGKTKSHSTIAELRT